jgi:acetyl-CoA carboxylase, biotin carboxylase subunit
MVSMFDKVLIANRSEIAVRVIRACREMGIRTVAVYSEADRGALHVRMADEAYGIGPSPASESYLVISKIVDVAKRAKATAVHPGYGFLSENAAFAKACEDAGLIFIGPSPSSMALMGSKVEARRATSKFGVPIVPGTVDPITDDKEAEKIAASIGYPIMLKASAGGGGKGLRFVRNETELQSALRDARSEAKSAFGNDAVYVEKFVERPRHIEIQVLADQHGNSVYIGERECSIQRRHQKVIEECPSPIMTPDLRSRMGEAALNVVKAAHYYNAGTVEFLVDQNRQFYFLEMNTRLQVEHPVTELVTGLDLVKYQLRIASGEKLDLHQDDIVMRGAAIECRVYAEDPANNFLPSPGRITAFRPPSGPGVRHDTGVYQGWTVPNDYDPLIAKLATWDRTRSDSIERMRRALSEYQIAGIHTNISFFLEVLADPDFQQANYDTGFLDRWMQNRNGDQKLSGADRDIAVIAAALFQTEGSSAAPAAGAKPIESPWKTQGRRNALRTS